MTGAESIGAAAPANSRRRARPPKRDSGRRHVPPLSPRGSAPSPGLDSHPPHCVSQTAPHCRGTGIRARSGVASSRQPSPRRGAPSRRPPARPSPPRCAPATAGVVTSPLRVALAPYWHSPMSTRSCRPSEDPCRAQPTTPQPRLRHPQSVGGRAARVGPRAQPPSGCASPLARHGLDRWRGLEVSDCEPDRPQSQRSWRVSYRRSA